MVKTGMTSTSSQGHNSVMPCFHREHFAATNKFIHASSCFTLSATHRNRCGVWSVMTSKPAAWRAKTRVIEASMSWIRLIRAAAIVPTVSGATTESRPRQLTSWYCLEYTRIMSHQNITPLLRAKPKCTSWRSSDSAGKQAAQNTKQFTKSQSSSLDVIFTKTNVTYK